MPHWLLTQVAVPLAGAGQVCPHWPQLVTSVLVSTHWLSQRMSEPLHSNEHLPVLQRGAALAGAPQTVPHFPQFDVSEGRSTHEPEQAVLLPQSVVQTPDWHTSPLLQALPHLLQLPGAELRSTHLPPQSV
jgi:hypothetical protein